MAPPVRRVSKTLIDGKEAPLRTFRHWADFHQRSISEKMSDPWHCFFSPSLFLSQTPERQTHSGIFFSLTNSLPAECRGAAELWVLTKPVWWCPTTGVGVTINTADAAWCMTPIIKADASFLLNYGREREREVKKNILRVHHQEGGGSCTLVFNERLDALAGDCAFQVAFCVVLLLLLLLFLFIVIFVVNFLSN